MKHSIFIKQFISERQSLLRMIGVVCLFLMTGQLFAQSGTVSGRITDSKQEPLIGANVLVKGTSKGTTTDTDGSFSLQANQGETLTFSYIGYLPQETVIRDFSPLSVVLQEDLQGMEEVVVIGYQTIKKADLTGAVSVFKPDVMKNTIVTGTVSDVLGTVPGVVVRTSGEPGAEGWVEIRGTKSLGSSTPLYVIDGVVVDGKANRDFNYNDIESIQVLKDASAAAIYGSKAANGVIIITTKKGSEGPMKIDFSAKTTLQWLPRYDLTDRDQWIKWNDLAFANVGLAPANHSDANTDWQDVVFKTGVVQDYNLAFSGGGKGSRYYLSGNYQSNLGATIGTKSERVTFRTNSSSEKAFGSKFIFRVGENLILSNYTLDNLDTNPIIDVYRMLPTIPVRDPNNPGGYGYGNGAADVTFGTNSVAKEDLTRTSNSNLRIRGNVFAELEFSKMLKYRFSTAVETSSDHYQYLRKFGNWSYNQPADPSSLNKNMAAYRSWTYDNTLEFNKKVGLHDINAVAGSSFMNITYEQIWGMKNNLLSLSDGTYYEQLDAGTTDPKTGGYKNIEKLFSLFGRINYAFADKYLLSGTIRRDASSKFGPDYRNGIFPSGSVGWRISKEDFFHAQWINDLKLRANYGVLGSSNIGVWDYMSFINSFPQAIFGTDQHIVSGQTQTQLANNDLKWEELREWNFGVDAAFLKNRLDVSLEYYISTSKDVLTAMPILYSTGNDGGNPNVNAVSLRNTGFELSATWRDKAGDWRYSVNLNASTQKNSILKIGYGKTEFSQFDTKSMINHPIGDWWLIKTDGLFKSMDEVYAHVDNNGNTIQPSAQPGDIRYIDFNGDGQITDADRQYCGTSLPKVQLGLTMTLAWKGFDLLIQGSGAFGQKYFNGPRSAYDRFDDNSNYRVSYDPWTPDNPNAKDPRPLYGDMRNSMAGQDRWLENGSYFRIKQISLGYTFPKFNKLNFLDEIRIFANAQNMITFTKYTGIDPEFTNTTIWDRGYDWGAFPNPYGVTFGLDINF